MWTLLDCISNMQAALTLMNHYGETPTRTCQIIGESHKISPKKLQAKLKLFLQEGKIQVASGATRGFATTPYWDNVVELTDVHKDAVEQQLDEWKAAGQTPTRRMIQKFLKEECGVKVITLKRISHYLCEWKCVYGKMKEVAKVSERWHSWKIARYIVQHHRAMQEEENGMYVIVYSDESYIHSNHAGAMGWCREGSDRLVVRERRTGRLVIFHAITKNGLLTHSTHEHDADLSIITPNAEYIYEVEKPKSTKVGKEAKKETVATAEDKKDHKESYHGNINSKMWYTWLENRLIPAFRARYPGKKVILVMDNASYHKGRDDDWKSPSEMRKGELAAALRKYKIMEVTVDREGEQVTFAEDTWDRTGGARSPNKEELRDRLKNHYSEHPELIPNRTQQLFDGQGWQVLWTPPLEPQCQPIEEVWGIVKNYCGSKYFHGRRVEHLRKQLSEAFYEHEYSKNSEDDEEERKEEEEKEDGDRKKRKKGRPKEEGRGEESKEKERRERKKEGRGIRASTCRGLIRHTRAFMQRWIDDHPEWLAGTLGVGQLEVRGSYADGLWGAPESDEYEDEEIEDMEWQGEMMEDWAAAVAMDELTSAAEMLSKEQEVGEGAIHPPTHSPSLPQPSLLTQYNPLGRSLHPIFSESGVGRVRLCFNNV